MIKLDGVPWRGVGLGPLNSIERYEEISTQILGSAQSLRTGGTHGCTREVQAPPETIPPTRMILEVMRKRATRNETGLAEEPPRARIRSILVGSYGCDVPQ